MTTLRSADDLIAAGLASEDRRADIDAVSGRYAVAITETLARLMAGQDSADPIVRQFLPDAAELRTEADERADPIGDEAFSPVQGLVHRYPDRVLLKLVSVCAVYCRFCFRREMVGPGAQTRLSPEALDRALAYIAAHAEIWEVILTGGDPFMVSPRRMSELMARLALIAHVQVARLHTRVPIAAPERVTDAFVNALRAPGLTTYVAIHANHVRELTPAARDAIARLADAGLALVSQTVLLRGVNDTPEALTDLLRALVACRVKPYYLHHPDLAPGTSHFRLSIAEGQALMSALRGRISGLCMPAYVLDIPGGHGKVSLTPSALVESGVIDRHGVIHSYPPAS